MKKLVRRPAFNDYADTAAVNCWRSMHLTSLNSNSKWRNASDKKILAKIRMRNQNLDGYGCGYANPTFRQPTDCKSGFFNVLLEVNDTPGQRSKDIEKKVGVKSLAMTFRRLQGAKLIEGRLKDGVTEWYATKFGEEYLDAAFKEFYV